MFLTVLFFCVLNALAVFGQLSGRVGPTTSRSAKQATICNVLSYGGKVGSSVCAYNISSMERDLLGTCCCIVGHWSRYSVGFQQLRHEA